MIIIVIENQFNVRTTSTSASDTNNKNKVRHNISPSKIVRCNWSHLVHQKILKLLIKIMIGFGALAFDVK